MQFAIEESLNCQQNWGRDFESAPLAALTASHPLSPHDRQPLIAMAAQTDAAERLRGLSLSSEALCAAAAAAPGDTSTGAAAQTALLQLHSLLSVSASTGAAPASRHAADGLLQQCTTRLHGLTVQHHRSDARQVGGDAGTRRQRCPVAA